MMLVCAIFGCSLAGFATLLAIAPEMDESSGQFVHPRKSPKKPLKLRVN
jgi:hypothetical protein